MTRKVCKLLDDAGAKDIHVTSDFCHDSGDGYFNISCVINNKAEYSAITINVEEDGNFKINNWLDNRRVVTFSELKTYLSHGVAL